MLRHIKINILCLAKASANAPAGQQFVMHLHAFDWTQRLRINRWLSCYHRKCARGGDGNDCIHQVAASIIDDAAAAVIFDSHKLLTINSCDDCTRLKPSRKGKFLSHRKDAMNKL